MVRSSGKFDRPLVAPPRYSRTWDGCGLRRDGSHEIQTTSIDCKAPSQTRCLSTVDGHCTVSGCFSSAHRAENLAQNRLISAKPKLRYLQRQQQSASCDNHDHDEYQNGIEDFSVCGGFHSSGGSYQILMDRNIPETSASINGNSPSKGQHLRGMGKQCNNIQRSYSWYNQQRDQHEAQTTLCSQQQVNRICGEKGEKTHGVRRQRSQIEVRPKIDKYSTDTLMFNSLAGRNRAGKKLATSRDFASTDGIRIQQPKQRSCEQLTAASKRAIATYLKRNFYSKDVVWQTDLISDQDSEESTSSEPGLSEYDNTFEDEPTKLKVNINESPAGDHAVHCATVTVTDGASKLALSQMSKAAGITGESRLKVRNHSDYKRTAFNFPSLSEQSTSTRGGIPSTSNYSDLFDVGSGISKVKLTRCHQRAHNPVKPSLESICQMVKRNLVATLVGVYILVSLTMIIVLILPYVFNLPLTIAVDNSNGKQIQDMASYSTINTTITTNTTTSKMVYKSTTSQPLDHPPVDSKATQTDPQLSASAPAGGSLASMASTGELASHKKSAHSQLAPTKSRPTTLDGLIPVKILDEQPPQLTSKSADQMGEETSNGTRKRGTKLNNQQQPLAMPQVGEGYGGKWFLTINQPCQPMKVPFCSRSFDSSSGQILPYDKTILPNQFTATKQAQIERFLQRYEPIIDIKCYALMPLFLCSIYVPKCIEVEVNKTEPPPPTLQSDSSDELEEESDLRARALPLVHHPYGGSTKGKSRQQQPSMGWIDGRHQDKRDHWSRLVPPCRSLCKEAFRKCTFFFEVLSLKLLDPQDCESLPESSDPNICIGQLESKQLQSDTLSQRCPDDKFRCTDGECIPKKWRCDGFADCTDKSDEDKCSKCNVVTQFYCGQDICININQVCNGIRDCKDGRDERQCLRLSRQASSKHQAGLLEVWSAVKGAWVTVCGTHWSAVPMSHEACQALGYSRANETLILFNPSYGGVGPSDRSMSTADGNINGQKHDARAYDLPLPQTKSPSAIPDPHGQTKPSNFNHSPIDDKSSRNPTRPAAWFDVTNSEHYAGGDPLANSDDAQFVGIVEDMASVETSLDKSKRGKLDHSVTYGHLESINGVVRDGKLNPLANISHDLSRINEDEIKFKSLTSMLYHGPQAGCIDIPDHRVSTVHLKCQNFQCGRSITSHSTRVRSLQQHSPDNGVFRLKNSNTKLTSRSDISDINSAKVSELNLTIDKNITKDKDRIQRSEAEEELNSNYGLSGSSEIETDDTFEDEPEVKSYDYISTLNRFTVDQQQTLIQTINPDIRDIVSSRFVVGGIESMPGEFPYLAALHGGPDEVFFCGAVLISINWLITASHCVGNRTQPDGWMVKVGITRRIASPAFVKKLKARRIIKHPNFNHDSLFNNDIALILLEESVEFNQYLRPICLPRADLKLGPDNSKDCVVVGFGKSKFSQDANYLHVAHFVNVPIVRHSTCSNWYADHGVNLTEGMLCAGYAEGKRDACQGDSGSGLFCRYSNTNQFFVAGVVSFGIKCATPKLPGVYTSVPYYVNWIESTTRQYGYPLN